MLDKFVQMSLQRRRRHIRKCTEAHFLKRVKQNRKFKIEFSITNLLKVFQVVFYTFKEKEKF